MKRDVLGRPALRAGRRLSTGPPPAFGGRRPHKIPPTRIQKLFASNWYPFWAKAFLCEEGMAARPAGRGLTAPSALWALAAAQRESLSRYERRRWRGKLAPAPHSSHNTPCPPRRNKLKL
jgi:hypothetical protein